MQLLSSPRPTSSAPSSASDPGALFNLAPSNAVRLVDADVEDEEREYSEMESLPLNEKLQPENSSFTHGTGVYGAQEVLEVGEGEAAVEQEADARPVRTCLKGAGSAEFLGGGGGAVTLVVSEGVAKI